MVFLNRIYTRSGDGGETGLGDGRRVPKTDARIAAYGGVDELNTLLGVTAANVELPAAITPRIATIQNDLFDLGADLCVPETDTPPEHPPLRVTSEQVARLETWIDESNESLEPLTSFVLPGGSPAAAHLHNARAVCRRVEIGVCHLAAAETINEHSLAYLNRLSDLLFVWARYCNDAGNNDVLWVPGGER
ncbi:Cob(I)yrinic acid a,c-diamide adenosyltransferase [Symmachiella dynata]|uniref:Corrinoid adenosyltransferase n=1 Tax=Symmachiella dynata TaxID=2527995 RepID=A0A517ZY67_9PLAN|nr:cob(I)yrinic acid a,c-diamide adenosyltransferase [Symmachiella dynata]QDU47422.1 Cob(I)yrinic acid a,c-diamide adenosyltransferase [Symmachiella dynata]